MIWPSVAFVVIPVGAVPPLAAAELTRHEGRSLVLVLLASALGALLSRLHTRVVLPTVVVEIVLGIVIGKEVLDIAEVNTYITFLSNFGLAFLFFFAGVEVVEKRVQRASLRRGTVGWGISLAIGLAAGVILQQAGVDAEWWLLGVALATTALGTLVPILIDAGILPTTLGSAVLGTGVAGEFWPIIFISVFLTSRYGALTEVLLLVLFGAIVCWPRGLRSGPGRRASSASSRRPCTRRGRRPFVRPSSSSPCSSSLLPEPGSSTCSGPSRPGSSSASRSIRLTVRSCGCASRESGSGS